MFVRGEEVPVTSYEERAMERVDEGGAGILMHLGSDTASEDGGEVLVVDVPKDSGGLGERRKAKAKGTSRNCEGVINLKVGMGGGGGFPNKKCNSSFSGVVCE